MGNLEPPLLPPGSMVDHFRLMRLLGRGAHAEVYLARDTSLGRRVALKLIHPQFVATQAGARRFAREGRALAQLNHPHIVTVHSVGSHDGRPYLALEYLEGSTLRERLRDDRPAFAETQRLALAIAEALEEAHRLGVLHRDLKPANIIIPKDGRLRVLDFGLVQATEVDDEEGDVSMPGQIVGTPAYLAPERWQGRRATPAADIWSFGVLLHEMIRGERPFRAGSTSELAAKVTDPQPITVDLQDKDATLSTLLCSCLAKIPDHRPSAREVVLSLRRLVGGQARPLDRAPFRGLLPFDAQHADLFFGREAEIEAFVERLREAPVLPVVGPSGSGKSSFVQAGVLPRLTEQGPWIVIRLRPGLRPFDSLARAVIAAGCASVREPSTTLSIDASDPTQSETLPSEERTFSTTQETTISATQETAPGGESEVARVSRLFRAQPTAAAELLRDVGATSSKHVLLFVDQLEEVYTLVDDQATQRAFAQTICSIADDWQDPIRVIFTLREDFLGRLAETPGALGALLHVTVLPTPDTAALRQILLKPLELVDYRYDDPSLVAEMLDAVCGERAGLPLLQFVAHELWEARDEEQRVLRRADYEAMGGVAGALAAHADGVLERLSPVEIQIARELLLRLVTPARTRLVVGEQQLLADLGPEAARVLDHLTRGRLVSRRRAGESSGGAEIELVHESLVQVWGRLSRWIEVSREDLDPELREAARLWIKRGMRVEEVWQGTALHEARRAIARAAAQVPQEVQQFLRAGELRERRRVRRKRLVGSAVLLGLSGIAIVLATQKREAEQQRASAQQRWAEAAREGALAALRKGNLLEARARLRVALEIEDSPIARGIWHQLAADPLTWQKELGGAAYDLSFFPDGHALAVASGDKVVYLLDASTRSVLRALRGHRDQVSSVAVAPDGKMLASADWSGRILLWSLPQERRRALHGHRGAVSYVCFSPDGEQLASSGWDRTVRLWDANTGMLRKVLRGHTDRVYGIAFSADSRTLVSGSWDRTARRWDVSTGSTKQVYRGHADGVLGIDLSPDGELLATGSIDRTIRLWDVATGRSAKVLEGHTDRVYAVSFAPDGQHLASGSWDRTVRVWDVADGALQRVYRGHGSAIEAVRFSPSGRHVASGSRDRRVRLWDVASAASQRVEVGHAGWVYAVAFHPKQHRVASAGLDRTVRLWDAASGDQLAVLRGHGDAVRALAFSPDGNVLVSASADRTIRVWNLVSNEHRVMAGHAAELRAVTFSPDGTLVASSGIDRTVRLWNVAAGTQRAALAGHTAGVYALAFRPDGRLIASAGVDRTIRLWEVPSGKPTGLLQGHTAGIFGLVFGPTGQLYSSSEDGTIRSWQLESGRSEVLARYPYRLYALAIDRAGRLAAAGADGVVPIKSTDASAATQGIILRGHRDNVRGVAFSADDRLVATSGYDGTVRLWDARTGAPVWRAPLLLPGPFGPLLLGHRGMVWLASTAPSAAPISPSAWQRTVEQRARRAAGTRIGKHVCLETFGGSLALWDTAQDERIFEIEIGGIDALVAVDQGCLVLARGQAKLVDRAGAVHRLVGEATAIAAGGGGFLVAAGERVSRFSAKGERVATYRGGRQVTAISIAGDLLALGHEDGHVDAVSITGDERGRIALRQGPSSPVVSIISGPQEMLIVGHDDGSLGLWSLTEGERIGEWRLHGAVVHLLLEQNRLFAATEQGDHVVVDLSVFLVDHCGLLKRVWHSVPAIWQQGRLLKRSPPANQRCSSGCASAARRDP